MRSSTRIRRRLIWAGILVYVAITGIMMPIAVSMAQDDEVVLIGNANIPERALSKAEVQNIFLGKMTKIDGTKITFVILKSGDTHTEFLATYLSRTVDQYTKYWKKLVFSGKGRSPKAFDTEEDMITYIGQKKGALGYIAMSTAQSLQSENIRELPIQ